MKELVAKLRKVAPTYSFEAVQGKTTPYITYSLDESPIRTKSGIAGYEGTLSLAIYAASREQCDTLVQRVVEVLDRATCDGRRLYYASNSEVDYQDIGLVSKELSFNTLT